ncbi:MAG: ABC transporter permease [Chloroflexi bacterium]|nr:ABC transporter permease [Chloroflexota bacterium]
MQGSPAVGHEIAAPQALRSTRGRGAHLRRGIARFISHQPLGSVAAVVLIILIVVAILAPVIAPYGELDSDRVPGKGIAMLEGPSGRHWLGTDEAGRDIFSRILIGARVSVAIGFIAVGVGTTIGSLVGIISAFFGGKVDMTIQRIADGIMAFPGLVFLLFMVSVLGGASFMKIFMAIAVLFIPGTNRVIRSAVLSVRNYAFVEAATCIGAGNLRILARHIVPNVAPIIIIMASIQIGGAILLDASLGFLGLGAIHPKATWGTMLSSQGRRYMEQQVWMALAPGLAISLVVFSFNMFGDALRDVLDPRLRGT